MPEARRERHGGPRGPETWSDKNARVFWTKSKAAASVFVSEELLSPLKWAEETDFQGATGHRQAIKSQAASGAGPPGPPLPSVRPHRDGEARRSNGRLQEDSCLWPDSTWEVLGANGAFPRHAHRTQPAGLEAGPLPTRCRVGSAKGLRKAQRAAGPPEGQRMPKARRDSPADPQAAYACFLVAMTQVDRPPTHTRTTRPLSGKRA